MLVEVSTRESFALASATTGMERAFQNRSVLTNVCPSTFTPNLVATAVLAGRIPLKELSGRLNLSGIQELSPLQRRVYDAITNPDLQDQTMPGIANILGLRDANLQRLCGRVYKHLGIKGRGQATLFRLASEVNSQNAILAA